jgi:hypothetical protein
MRYRLRTLLILMAIVPPVLAAFHRVSGWLSVQQPASNTILYSDNGWDLVPWHPPGSPQESALGRPPKYGQISYSSEGRGP